MKQINETFENKDFKRLVKMKVDYDFKNWREFILAMADTFEKSKKVKIITEEEM